MALAPLKIQLSESQKSLVQQAIEEQSKGKFPFLGTEPPTVDSETLVIDPHDFVIMLAYLPRNDTTELEAFRLRAIGIAEMQDRLERCSKDSTKLAYTSLLGHAQRTLPIGAAVTDRKDAPLETQK